MVQRGAILMKYRINGALVGLSLVLFVDALHAGAPAGPSSREREAPVAFRVPAVWEYSAPLISPAKRDNEPSRAQKDPTVVQYGGKWHVFMTVKRPGRSAIEYCMFERWEEADRSPRTLLKISDSD